MLLTSFAALDAVRHIPIFILVAMPVITAALASASDSESNGSLVDPEGFEPSRNLCRIVVVLLAMLAIVKWVTLARNQEARESEQFPAKAVAFLQRRAAK